jgi:hypothetical protein
MTKPDPADPYKGLQQLGRQLAAMRHNMDAAAVFGMAYRGEPEAAVAKLKTLPIADQVRIRAAAKLLLDAEDDS